MPYYDLFWMRSPYLDLQWRSYSTGIIPELLITSIVWHKNKNRWVGDPLWRSYSLFCVVIFHSSFILVKYPYTKQFTWSPQGIPPLPVLVILFKSKLFKWWMSHGDMTDYGYATIIGVLFKSLNPSQNRTQLLFNGFICIDFSYELLFIKHHFVKFLATKVFKGQ